MYERQVTGFREMGMSVDIVGFSVSCPTGMRYTHTATDILPFYGLFQISHLTLGLVNDQITVVIDKRHTRAVITSVLQAREPLEQYRASLPFTDIAYNSAHKLPSIKGEG